MEKDLVISQKKLNQYSVKQKLMDEKQNTSTKVAKTTQNNLQKQLINLQKRDVQYKVINWYKVVIYFEN